MAETLRKGLQAGGVSIWFRDDATGCFRCIEAPIGDGAPRLLESLDDVGGNGTGVRLPLEHDEVQIGLLEVRGEPGPAELEVLAIVSNVLAPFLASLALSADFAIEVAAQSREIEEQRRFSGLFIDSLPVGLYVVDRE